MLRRNMARQQLLGKFARLRAELVAAYAEPTRRNGLIERLSRDIDELDRESANPADEHGVDDLVPGLLSR